MVAFTFSVGFYAYSDLSPTSAQTQNTVSYPNGQQFTVASGASSQIIIVRDDDNNPAGSPLNTFDDGYVDPTGDGSPSSTANNDQVLKNPITVNGNTYPAGSQVELEFGFTTTSGDTFYIVRIDGVNVGITGPMLPVPGTTYTVNGSSDGQSIPFGNIACFTAGALVETPEGARAIETLRQGDLVLTRDHGAQPIRWIGETRLPAEVLAREPQLRPILVRAGALGAGQPACDMQLSPQHRILLRSPLCELHFGVNEVLCPALALLGRSVVKQAAAADVHYFHILLDRHEIITVDSLLTESLFPDARQVPSALRAEMDRLMPGRPGAQETARMCLKPYEAAALAEALTGT